MGRSAGDLHVAAVELVNEGRLTSARRMLIAAADRADDVSLRARISGTLAYVLAQTGELAEAEQLCAEALRMPGIDAHTGAILAGQMGALAERAGRLDDAERWLGRGIGGLEDDPVGRANLLINRSLINMQRRRLDDAVRDTVSAIDEYVGHDLPVAAAQARHNLGYIGLLRGDLVTALQEMSRARGTLAEVSAAVAATCDVDRAEVLRDAGLTTEAERILGRAAAVFGSNRMPLARAEAEFNLARSQLTHEPARAARSAAAAARRFRALGNETAATRAEAVRLRALLSGPRGMRAARAAEVDAVVAALESRGFRSEAAALRMARELSRARAGARGDGGTRVIRTPRTASMDVRLLAYEVRAARAAATGRDGEARRHAAAGLDTLGHWQRAFGSLDLQTSISMHGSGLVFAGLSAAVRSRRPSVLFEWSERARHLSQQVVPLRPPPDAALAGDLAELRMLRADDPTGAWLRDPRAAALHERARERQWSATGAAEILERVTLAGLRAALDDETALLAYVYSGDALTALVVTRDRATIVDLTGWPDVQRALPGLRADLDMSATVRVGPIADAIRRSLADRLAALSAALLDRPAAVAGVRRLVLTVPGILTGIPWAMLPAMRGRVFTLATSATRWVAQRGALTPHAVVGFAAGPRVARGEEEVDAAVSSWTDAVVLRAADASVDAVTELASRVDLLHVAAHGRHAVDNPLFSGLELADGTLFGYDIDRMPQVPATVMLSACEVGRSSVRWGEEAIGMTRTWLHAGSLCVVAAPVVVADDVACELLGAMHEGLVAGAAPADALAAAADRTGHVAPFQAHGAGF